MDDPLTRATDVIPASELARKLGVTPSRLSNWKNRGMPRTELTGETDFASIIERETHRQVRKNELLEWSFPHLKRVRL